MAPPLTEGDLRDALAGMGVRAGMTLVVHSSLSSIGRVAGGPATLVRALTRAVGDGGTLVMPGATPGCAGPTLTRPRGRTPHGDGHDAGDTGDGSPPPDVPVFDAAETPTTLGVVPETFRTWPGTLRSDHPLESVCARGRHASLITAVHPLEFPEGPGSPWSRLVELDARVLLIGVGFNRCTALHHAESLAATRRTAALCFVAIRAGRRAWVEIRGVADDNDTHFPVVGRRFAATGGVHSGVIGKAPSSLLSMRDLVRFATRYFEEEL